MTLEEMTAPPAGELHSALFIPGFALSSSCSGRVRRRSSALKYYQVWRSGSAAR
jgi:hypothetical protein